MQIVHGEDQQQNIERKMKTAQSEVNKKVVQNKEEPKEPTTYMCSRSNCKKEFEDETEYDNHVEIEHKELPVDDKKALKETSELTAALDAINKENPGILELQENIVKKEEFNCDKCNFKTNSNRNIRTHKRTTHDNIQNKCNQCSQIVNSNQSLLLHIRQNHGVKLDCDKCAFKTKSPMIMRQHKRRLHMTLIKCDECPREFKTKTEVTTHKKSHKVSFKCEHCEFAAISRRALNIHIDKDHVESNTPQRGTKRSQIQSPETTPKTEAQTKPTEKKPKVQKYKFPTKEKDVIGGAGYKTEEKKHNKPGKNLETKTTSNIPLQFENLPSTVAWTLPEHKDSLLQIVLGDGACCMRVIAIHLGLNEDEGLQQSKAFNKHLVANRDIYEPSTKFPKTVTYSTKHGKVDVTYKDTETDRNKYFEFLDTETAKYIWRESDEMRYLATFLNLEIEVVKILRTGKIELPVQKYSPDEDFEQEAARKPKVTMLNTNDNHFNLIIKKETVSLLPSPPPLPPKTHSSLDPTSSPSSPPLPAHNLPITCTSPNNFECDYCHKKESTVTNLELHTELEHSSDVIKRLKLQIKEFTNKLCHSKEQFQTHVEWQNTSKVPFENSLSPPAPRVPQDSPKKQQKKLSFAEILSCDQCGNVFLNKQLMDKHAKMHKNQQNYIQISKENVFRTLKGSDCNECGENFASKNQLRHHMKESHKDMETLPMETEEEIEKSKETNFICKICKVERNTLRKLEKHMANHNEDGDWFCEECDFQTNRISMLTNHMKENDHIFDLIQVKLTKCPFCEELFQSRSEMVRHRKISHPTFKPCRNQTGCVFKFECIYSHDITPEGMSRCYECGEYFQSKKGMMLHRKNRHIVKTCKNWLENNCQRVDQCWWDHKADQPNQTMNRDFQQTQENLAPPAVQQKQQQTQIQNQPTMNQLMNMIMENMNTMRNLLIMMNTQ